MIHFSVTYHEQFAYVKFDMQGEKVNKFNKEAFHELSDLIDELEKKINVEWVLFDSSKAGIFIAGADINELSNLTSYEEGKPSLNVGMMYLIDCPSKA